jgi:hypothetical protein
MEMYHVYHLDVERNLQRGAWVKAETFCTLVLAWLLPLFLLLWNAAFALGCLENKSVIRPTVFWEWCMYLGLD